MEWPQLLDSTRLRGEDTPRQPTRSHFERDYDRILFCDAFRRLNGKTQVFPLSEDDHVHTRLSHSLEVASVGRSLGTRAGEILRKRKLLPSGIHPRDLGDIVSSASLAHDLGNPPFGHSGEDAISEWVRKRTAEQLKLTEDQYFELSRCEGNALGFRILVRHQRRRKGGLRLCCATLAAFTKYPNACLQNRPRARGVQHKKYGFLRDDAALFAAVANNTGLHPLDDLMWTRHPLAFLVEAADDICYSIIDLEDGFRLGHISLEMVRDLLLPLARSVDGFEQRQAEYEAEGRDHPQSFVSALRAHAIHGLVSACLDVFDRFHDSILNGEHRTTLVDDCELSDAVQGIQAEVVPRCYRATDVVQIERAGFGVLDGILDVIYEAIHAPDDQKSAQKTRQVFPRLERIRTSDQSDYWKLVSIIEFVAGMTDRFALQTYRRLRGMELPGRV